MRKKNVGGLEAGRPTGTQRLKERKENPFQKKEKKRKRKC
jgi:hypothetical protein